MTKILVIEDEATIREEIVDWLTFEGYEPISAANGREGVTLATKFLPDLIISDITMPELDGYGVLTALQQQPQTKSIPFIFLTAHADKAFVRQGMESGADDYITKPFTPGELLAAIQARLSRHQVITTGVREEVTELKTKLLQLVSQELKNPLEALNFVQQIIERQFGQLEEDQLADLLQTMRVGTDHLQHVVQQIVYLTQIETGSLTVERIHTTGNALSMWQVITPAIDLARRWAYQNQDGGIAVWEADKNATFWGRGALIKHALAELLTHALENNQALLVNQRQAEGRVWLHIVDQTSPDNAMPAFRKHETRELVGLGLGLMVARRIIDLHEGTFQMHSTGGIQIIISLPLYTDEA